MKDYDRLKSKLQKEELKPVYFLDGDECYLKDKLVSLIVSVFEKGSGTDVDTVTYRLGEIDVQELDSLLNESSLFGCRVIVIKEFEKYTSLFADKLNGILKDIKPDKIPSNILVLYTSERTGVKGKLDSKLLKKKGEYAMLWRPFPDELKFWIIQYLKGIVCYFGKI